MYDEWEKHSDRGKYANVEKTKFIRVENVNEKHTKFTRQPEHKFPSQLCHCRLLFFTLPPLISNVVCCQLTWTPCVLQTFYLKKSQTIRKRLKNVNLDKSISGRLKVHHNWNLLKPFQPSKIDYCHQCEILFIFFSSKITTPCWIMIMF